MAKNFGNNKNFNLPKNQVEKNFYNPYSFVGLTNDVLTLDTSEDNNEVDNLNYVQDVPFEDGYSGKIEIDFESLTKFCVLGAEEHNTNICGRYYVPGSSIKGMLRTVFEMITFSNIKNNIEDNKYSMRNLRSNDYELKDLKKGDQKPGFIIKINGEYYIQECEFTRYRYEDPKRIETSIRDIYKNLDIFKFKRAKTKEKYNLLKTRFMYDNNGNDAMWFFSGPMANKKHEFLLSIPTFSEKKSLIISEKVWNEFLFIHEEENENDSWKYWRGILKNYKSFDDVKKEGVVPCFFRKREGKIIDLGLAYLYRVPYPKSIHQYLPKNLRSNRGIDIAQAVFGYVNGKDALKGRVIVGNSLLGKDAKPGKAQTFIMGAPKPTYFEFYLNQDTKQTDPKNGKQKTNTFFTNNAQINGYKRYLIHDKEIEGNEPQSKVTSTFYPMPENTKFTTTVYFHNLLDYELGALLSAITFCKNQHTCFHSLGYAKPFGYGKLRVEDCKITVIETNSDCNNGKTADDFYKAFNNLIADCDLKRQLEDVLTDLITISRGQYNPAKEIRYPKSGMESTAKDKNNEFVAIQNGKLSLKDFEPKK